MKKTSLILALAVMALALMTSCTPDYKKVTLDFEGAYWDALVDNPQYGGKLIYGTYNSLFWTWSGAEGYTWTDNTTMLEFPGFPDVWGSRCYSSGGEVISNYVSADFKGKDYNSQLEVPVAPKKGKNFVVHYGEADPSATAKGSVIPTYSMIRFADLLPRTVKSIDICNTNYFLNACVYGNDMFGPVSGNTVLYVKAYGLDAAGNVIAITDTKLIDAEDVKQYQDGKKKAEWTKWNLSVLGSVSAIVFSVYGTADCYGDYGFNAPAYFAYDNVVVEMPNEK